MYSNDQIMNSGLIMMEKRWNFTEGDTGSVKLGVDEGSVNSISCSLFSWLDYTTVSFCSACLDLTKSIPFGN